MLQFPTIWWAQLWDSDFQYRRAQSQAHRSNFSKDWTWREKHTHCSICSLSEKASRGLKGVMVQSSFDQPSSFHILSFLLHISSPCTKIWWIWGDWWEEKPPEFERAKTAESVHVQKGMTGYNHPSKRRSFIARQKWKIIMTTLHWKYFVLQKYCDLS